MTSTDERESEGRAFGRRCPSGEAIYEIEADRFAGARRVSI
jgi:hypothetical protein